MKPAALIGRLLMFSIINPAALALVAVVLVAVVLVAVVLVAVVLVAVVLVELWQTRKDPRP